MDPEDADLIRRFLAGEAEALSRIDGWIRSAAWAFRQRLSSDWDDLQQDLRLEITRLLKKGAFRGEARLKTYLWRVVAHACLDRVRARSRWDWTDLDEATEGLERDGIELDEVGEHLAAQDLMRRVWQMAPEECRRLWALVLAGFSYAEMSSRVGIAAGTLRVRVLRCRKRAQSLRQDLLHEDEGRTL